MRRKKYRVNLSNLPIIEINGRECEKKRTHSHLPRASDDRLEKPVQMLALIHELVYIPVVDSCTMN